MKKLIFISFLGIFILTNCSNVQQLTIEENHKKREQSSNPKIDSYVNYYGIVPCDYCIAIETNIYLTNFQTFVQKERFLYKDYQTLKLTHGTFTFDNEDRSLINLSNGITYKIYNKNDLKKFKNYNKINKNPTFKQKQNAKKIYNVDINYHLIKRQ